MSVQTARSVSPRNIEPRTRKASLESRREQWVMHLLCGKILHFDVPGLSVTAGPYRDATGAAGFAGFRYGFRASECHGAASEVVVWLLNQVGLVNAKIKEATS